MVKKSTLKAVAYMKDRLQQTGMFRKLLFSGLRRTANITPVAI